MATLKQWLQAHVAGLGVFEAEANLPQVSGILSRAVDVLPGGPHLTGPKPATFCLEDEMFVMIPRDVRRIGR